MVRNLVRSTSRLLETSRPFLWLTTFVPLALLYLGTIQQTTYDMANDAKGVTPSAWSFAHHLTSRFPARLAPGSNFDFWLVPSGPGQLVTNRQPGLVWLAAVLYRLDPSARIGDVTPASWAAALTTAAAMATFAVVARHLVSTRTAIAAALVAGTATTTWAVAGRALWPHGPDILYIMAAALAVASGRHVTSGVAFGLGILTRPMLALSGAVVGLWAGARSRAIAPVVAMGLPQVAAVGVLLWYSGEFWDGGIGGAYTVANPHATRLLTNFGITGIRHFALNVAGTFVSPGQGILTQSSFLAVLLLGIRPAWRAAPNWVRSFAVAGLVYMLLQLKANRFSGGIGFWAYRYPLEPLAMLAPLLVLCWREWVSLTPRRVGAFTACLVISISLQCLGALSFRQPYPTHGGSWTTANLNVALYRLPIAVTTLVLFGSVGAAAAAYTLVQKVMRPNMHPFAHDQSASEFT